MQQRKRNFKFQFFINNKEWKIGSLLCVLYVYSQNTVNFSFVSYNFCVFYSLKLMGDKNVYKFWKNLTQTKNSTIDSLTPKFYFSFFCLFTNVYTSFLCWPLRSISRNIEMKCEFYIIRLPSSAKLKYKILEKEWNSDDHVSVKIIIIKNMWLDASTAKAV